MFLPALVMPSFAQNKHEKSSTPDEQKQEDFNSWRDNDSFCPGSAMVVCSTYGRCIFLGNGSFCISIPFLYFEEMVKEPLYDAFADVCNYFCIGSVSVFANICRANDAGIVYFLYDKR